MVIKANKIDAMQFDKNDVISQNLHTSIDLLKNDSEKSHGFALQLSSKCKNKSLQHISLIAVQIFPEGFLSF